MPHTILITYATKLGSTLSIAEAVAQVLRESGAEVAVLPARQVKHLRGYGAVVLGTAVRFGRPLGEALRFARRHCGALANLPWALFSVGTTVRDDTPENRSLALTHLAPITGVAGQPCSIGLFGGVVDFEKFPPLWRWFARMDSSGETGEGDWRDWGAIDAWAREVAEHLRAAVSPDVPPSQE